MELDVGFIATQLRCALTILRVGRAIVSARPSYVVLWRCSCKCEYLVWRLISCNNVLFRINTLFLKIFRNMTHTITQNVSLLQPNLVVERCTISVVTVLIQTPIHIQRESFALIQIVSFLLKNHWKILKKVVKYLGLCHCCNRILG